MTPHRPTAAVIHHAQHTDGPQHPMVIVLHDCESDGSGPAYLNGIFGFLDREGLSVHACIAKDGATGYAADANVKCRHAPPNTGKVGIEQAGFASFTREQWLARPHQLHATAQLVAWYSYRWNIPITHNTTHGVCMHVDLPEGGHHDPGHGYPFAYVLDLAKTIRHHTYPAQSPA